MGGMNKTVFVLSVTSAFAAMLLGAGAQAIRRANERVLTAFEDSIR